MITLISILLIEASLIFHSFSIVYGFAALLASVLIAVTTAAKQCKINS